MGKRFARCAPLALACLLVSCGDSSVTESFELSGVVSELVAPGALGPPVAGAAITFRSDTNIVATGVTDGAGRYRLRVETDYPFGQVRAEADGFLPAESTVFFDSPTRRVDLHMRRVGSP